MQERPDTLNNQAILLASDGDYSGAIACFKRALTIEKSNYLLWYNLGVTYRDAGDLRGAHSALSAAHRLAPENEDVTETFATICIDLNQLEAAMETVLDGIDLNDTNPHLWNLMGVIYFKQEDYGTAEEAFEVAVTLNPYYEDALYNLRDTYSELGNKTGAEECELRLKHLK